MKNSDGISYLKYALPLIRQLLKQDVFKLFKLQTMYSRKAFPRHYLYWSHIEDSCVGI